VKTGEKSKIQPIKKLNVNLDIPISNDDNTRSMQSLTLLPKQPIDSKNSTQRIISMPQTYSKVSKQIVDLTSSAPTFKSARPLQSANTTIKIALQASNNFVNSPPSITAKKNALLKGAGAPLKTPVNLKVKDKAKVVTNLKTTTSR
jgi:hypothetical protein